jgi:hypothetical protein
MMITVIVAGVGGYVMAGIGFFLPTDLGGGEPANVLLSVAMLEGLALALLSQVEQGDVSSKGIRIFTS